MAAAGAGGAARAPRRDVDGQRCVQAGPACARAVRCHLMETFFGNSGESGIGSCVERGSGELSFALSPRLLFPPHRNISTFRGG